MWEEKDVCCCGYFWPWGGSHSSLSRGQTRGGSASGPPSSPIPCGSIRRPCALPIFRGKSSSWSFGLTGESTVGTRSPSWWIGINDSVPRVSSSLGSTHRSLGGKSRLIRSSRPASPWGFRTRWPWTTTLPRGTGTARGTGLPCTSSTNTESFDTRVSVREDTPRWRR